jgi:hypothetical protein
MRRNYSTLNKLKTMKLYEVSGTYGSGKTPCTVFVADNLRWGKWYVCEGSQNVNLTYDPIEEGVNIEDLEDTDIFTSSKPINSLRELEQAIEE